MDNEGWIKNNGTFPCDLGTKVDVKFRSSVQEHKGLEADKYYWGISGASYEITHWRYSKAEIVTEPTRNKYMREIKPGVWVDVYDVLNAFKVTDPCLQHLLKKALAVGQRGHKDATEDYKDILASAKRAVELHEEWDK